MKTNLISIAAIAAVMFMISSCGQTNNTLTDEDRAAITKTHLAATNPVQADPGHADWKVFTEAHYSQDAVLLPPNSAEIVGRDAIVAYMSTIPKLTKFHVEDVKMEGTPSVTYIKYSYDMRGQINDSTNFAEVGRGIELWKKYDDGTWRCFLDIWNTDMLANQ